MENSNKPVQKKFAKYLPMSGFPQKRGTALQISIVKIKDSDNVRLFAEFAPQVKDKPPSGSTDSPFSWEQKIFIALKEEEVGKLLSVFRGRLKSAEIIHKFPIDAPKDKQKISTLIVAENEYNGVLNWKFGLSQKVGAADAMYLQTYLQPEDVEILVVMLQECIKKMYRLDA